MRHLFLPVLLALAVPASAHPLGKTSHSLYGALRVGGGTVSAVVILEVPRDVVLKDVQARIDAGTGRRKALKEHDQARFETLASGLTLQIGGQPAEVTWRPLDTPSNGKVVDDFFMYWIGAEVDAPTADTVQVSLTNTSYGDVDMVYSGSVQARGGWTVTANSAADVLGADPSTMDRMDPKAWTDDARLRTLSGTWAAPKP